MLPSITQADIHTMLLFLADLPEGPDVREAAFKLLQLLPTAPSVPDSLRQALQQGAPLSALQQGEGAAYSALKALMLDPAHTLQPARLLYSLQVRRGATVMGLD